MTEKFTRMNNLIPQLKINPLIQEIVSIESEWMKNLLNQNPLNINHKLTYFSKYLSCELETCSDKSIKLYFKDIQIANKNRACLTKNRFEYLIKKLGYSSLIELGFKRKLDTKD